MKELIIDCRAFHSERKLFHLSKEINKVARNANIHLHTYVQIDLSELLKRYNIEIFFSHGRSFLSIFKV